MTDIHPAWLEREQRRWLRNDAHLWLRPDHARFDKPRYLERKYSPDQPRVPAGNPDGGHWTRGGGHHEISASRRSRLLRRGSRPHGHHYVSVQIYGKMNLPPETCKVFDEAKTGRLRSHVHRGGSGHDRYTEAVRQLLNEFMASHKVKEEAMTPDQRGHLLIRSNDQMIRVSVISI